MTRVTPMMEKKRYSQLCNHCSRVNDEEIILESEVLLFESGGLVSSSNVIHRPRNDRVFFFFPRGGIIGQVKLQLSFN